MVKQKQVDKANLSILDYYVKTQPQVIVNQGPNHTGITPVTQVQSPTPKSISKVHLQINQPNKF